MDKELAEQLKEIDKINKDSVEIRKINDEIVNLMNNLEV